MALFCLEEWAKVPVTCSEKLVEGFPKCLTQFIVYLALLPTTKQLYLGTVSDCVVIKM